MPTKFNLERASEEFATNRRTLKRRLMDAGHECPKGAVYSVAEIHRALVGQDADVLAKIDAERLRKLIAECETLETALARERAELLDAADVAAVWTETVVALRTAVWNFDAPEPVRRRWLLELREIATKEYLAAKVKPVEATDESDAS